MSGNPIANLGDYNDVRLDLQACNGKKDLLYKKIGDLRIDKDGPKLIAKGVIIGAFITSTIVGGLAYGINCYKKRRQSIIDEPKLRKEFDELTDNSNNSQKESTESENISAEKTKADI